MVSGTVVTCKEYKALELGRNTLTCARAGGRTAAGRDWPVGLGGRELEVRKDLPSSFHREPLGLLEVGRKTD